jgi:hypothetical protein
MHKGENKMSNSINNFERTARNFYRFNGKAYRLFAKGITPNGCWLIAPKMIELVDIDVATGNDVYGKETIEFDVTGTVQAGCEFIKY